MSFIRPMILEGALQRAARVGDVPWNPVVTHNSTDSNQTIPVSAIAGGVWARTTSAGRSDTLPTAAELLALPKFAAMDIGESYYFVISSRAAFAITVVTATGITLVGLTACPASGSRAYLLQRTGAATFNLIGL